MAPFLLVILIWAGQAMIRKQQLTRKDGYVFLGVFCAYLITVFLLRAR
jgi:Ca2+/Na+ antiporter